MSLSETHTHLDAPNTVAAAVAHALAQHATQAFGLMGNGNAHLIDALTACGVTYTSVRHEAATVASADAYTRISGKLAVATTTYGAGFTNLLTALAEAAQARTPMLVVVGDAPTSGPRPWDVDQEMLGAALGVRTHLVSADDPAAAVDRAVAAAVRNRRPVVLGIPYDLVTTSLSPTGASTDEHIDLNDPQVIADLVAATRARPANGVQVPTPHTAAQLGLTHLDLEALAQAVTALASAQRPLILAGRGAALAKTSVLLGNLAERLGALTATTALARNVFPAPEYDLGITGGFGQEAAMSVITEADVVLVVGASLNQFTMRFGELFGAETTVVRVDVDQVAPPRTARPLTHVLLRGDAGAILAELDHRLTEARATPSGWRERVIGLEPDGSLRKRDSGTGDDEGLLADGLLDPRAVAIRLAELLPKDRHVTSDGGHFIGWANMYWPVAAPERMIMVGATYQTIGLGLATVAGVAAAAPDSTVVVTTGDGGALMALADLETAIRTAPSCVIVVWNDAAYSAEVHLYGVMGINETPMLIPRIDFAAMATALGATGVRVDRLSALDALAQWRDAGATGTLLLDCRVSRTVIAPYQYEVMRVNGIDVESLEP